MTFGPERGFLDSFGDSITSRTLRIAGTIWVIGVTVRYLATVQKSIRNPFNPGADIQWAWVLLAFVAVILGSLALFPARALKFWMTLLGSAGVVTIVLSGHFIPAIVAAWVLIVATILGDIILVKLGLRSSREDLCERFVLAFPIGITGLSLISLAMALVGLFTPAVAWTILLALTFAEFRHARKLLEVTDPSDGHIPTGSIPKSSR